jgi:hypothetical protein
MAIPVSFTGEPTYITTAVQKFIQQQIINKGTWDQHFVFSRYPMYHSQLLLTPEVISAVLKKRDTDSNNIK